MNEAFHRVGAFLLYKPSSSEPTTGFFSNHAARSVFDGTIGNGSRNKLVAEVQFDHFTGGRFRHGTRSLRWRPDKAPGDCTMEQVRRENRSALTLL
jgi:ATP-dependent DNA ligase